VTRFLQHSFALCSSVFVIIRNFPDDLRPTTTVGLSDGFATDREISKRCFCWEPCGRHPCLGFLFALPREDFGFLGRGPLPMRPTSDSSRRTKFCPPAGRAVRAGCRSRRTLCRSASSHGSPIRRRHCPAVIRAVNSHGPDPTASSPRPQRPQETISQHIARQRKNMGSVPLLFPDQPPTNRGDKIGNRPLLLGFCRLAESRTSGEEIGIVSPDMAAAWVPPLPPPAHLPVRQAGRRHCSGVIQAVNSHGSDPTASSPRPQHARETISQHNAPLIQKHGERPRVFLRHDAPLACPSWTSLEHRARKSVLGPAI